MSTSKEWTFDVFAVGKGLPWNLLPSYALAMEIQDAGSDNGGASALSATVRGYLRDEMRTTVAIKALPTVAADPATAKRLVAMGCRPPGLEYCWGGIMQFANSNLPYRDAKYGPWHYPAQLMGYYRIGSGSYLQVTLDESATMIDEDAATAVINTTAAGYHLAGVRVGSLFDNAVYAPIIDALVLWGASIPSTVVLLGSNDNANWTEITRSTLSGGGFSSGVGTITAGSPWGGAGKAFLFASPQNYAYYAVAMTTSTISSVVVAEMAALAKWGDVSITQDFEHYRGINPSNSPSISGLGATNSISQMRYTFPETWPIVEMRYRMRPLKLHTGAGDPLDDSIDIAHAELYTNPNMIDFADDTSGGLMTALNSNVRPGYTGEHVAFRLVNNHTLSTKSVQLSIPIDPQTVAGEAVPAEVNSFYLPHSAIALTQTGYILNASGTVLGTFGASSVVFGGAMVAWTEVAGVPAPGSTEYAVDYATGLVTLGVGALTPLGSTVNFIYGGLGSQFTKISEDNVTAIGIGQTLTLTNGVIPAGSYALIYIWADMTGRTERRAMPRKMHVQAEY